MSRIRPDWSSLPEHLLSSIAKFLHTRIDILRFRAVCRSFRSALPPPSKLLFPDSILTATDFLKGPNPSDDDEPFVLMESTVYAFEPFNEASTAHHEKSSQTWMIRVQESKPGTFQIIDPLGELRSKKLPRSLNLLDYRVTEITKSLVSPNCTRSILSSFPDETDDGFAVMTIYDSGRKLSMWRNVDKEWSNIDMLELEFPEFFEDMVYHNQKFYALVSSGYTITVDSKSLTVTHVADRLRLNLRYKLYYLVGSLKDLFLIVLYDKYINDSQCSIKVFKLNEKKCKWVPVVNGLELQDRALFVADLSGSYSVSAKEFYGCKGNCVYFSGDGIVLDDKCAYPGQDTWICDLKDGRLGHLSDFPGYSNLFWPPPAGLQ